MRAKYSNGYTLIELMLVVVIIGILAAVAYPAYTGYGEKARRSDAKHALLDMQLEQEKWRANNIRYTSTLSDLNWTTTSIDEHYDLAITSIATNAYTLTATVDSAGLQANDADCSTMTLNQNNEKTPASGCW